MNHQKESKIFGKFPKIRPSMPKEIEEIYSDYYKTNRDGKTIASFFARKMDLWLHKNMAKDVTKIQNSKKATLELGAGTLNQLPFELNCQPYDIVEPFTILYKDSPLLSKIRNIYTDISEVPTDYVYDRITSIGVLEHICNLPETVAKSGILLSENGVFRAGIPSEGTLLWTLSWRLTTGLEFKIKHGLDYGLIMKHEHVNSAKEIKEVLEFFFRDVECKVFGLSRTISLYHFYVCSNPRKDRCREFIVQRNS